MPLSTLKKIVTDGQMGVDRAALDVAKSLGIECCGITTRGCNALDGSTEHQYNLKQNRSTSTAARNIEIVEAADATLILTFGPLTENIAQLASLCKKQSKPVKTVDLNKHQEPVEVTEWLVEHNVVTLNICGPDDKNRQDIYRRSREFLTRSLEGKAEVS